MSFRIRLLTNTSGSGKSEKNETKDPEPWSK